MNDSRKSIWRRETRLIGDHQVEDCHKNTRYVLCFGKGTLASTIWKVTHTGKVQPGCLLSMLWLNVTSIILIENFRISSFTT